MDPHGFLFFLFAQTDLCIDEAFDFSPLSHPTVDFCTVQALKKTQKNNFLLTRSLTHRFVISSSEHPECFNYSETLLNVFNMTAHPVLSLRIRQRKMFLSVRCTGETLIVHVTPGLHSLPFTSSCQSNRRRRLELTGTLIILSSLQSARWATVFDTRCQIVPKKFCLPGVLMIM